MNAAAVLEKCRKLFHYDPLTGLFVRIKTAGNQKAGSVAGSLTLDGYIHIQVAGKRYKAHRLAWLMSYGDWPADTIDHVNGVKTDNQLANLRVVNIRENCHNPNTSKNTSGYPGVYWSKGKWRALIRVGGRRRCHLGCFADIRDAHAAYLLAAETLKNKE